MTSWAKSLLSNRQVGAYLSLRKAELKNLGPCSKRNFRHNPGCPPTVKHVKPFFGRKKAIAKK